jgi:hypothetical protein
MLESLALKTKICKKQVDDARSNPDNDQYGVIFEKCS